MNKWENIRNSRKGIGAIFKGAAFDLLAYMYDHMNAWGLFRPVVNIQKMNPWAIVPTRGTDDSAGLDIYAVEDVELRPDDIVKMPTGWAFEIPKGFFGLLVTRSSLGKDGIRIAAGANIIDSDYRNEVFAYMRNDGVYPRTIRRGDRFAQIVLVPVLMANLRVVDELSQTDRKGGFGSTGR